MNESDTPGPDDLPDIRSEYTKIRERNQAGTREFMEKHYVTIIEILMILFLVIAVYAMVSNKTIENRCNDFYQAQFMAKSIPFTPINFSSFFNIHNSGDNENKPEKDKNTSGYG